MASRKLHYALLSLLAGAVMLTNLGGAKLWDRDEPRNAGCAAEMLARGDWIVPVFNGELRTHKPVLLYWLILSAYQVLGIHEFSARLPSALLAMGTVLCTYEMGRRLFTPRTGMLAGLILSTSLLFVMAGRAATPDATLIFCSTLAVTLFVVTCLPRRSSLGTNDPFPSTQVEFSWPAAAAIYAAMGLAVLAKGPIGMILPTAVIGLFLLIQHLPAAQVRERSWLRSSLSFLRRLVSPGHFLRTCWAMRPLTAVIVCLLVAAPWYVAVGLRTDGEFLRGFFLEHNLSRAVQTMEGHRGNVLFYPLALLVGSFPWSVFAAPLIIDIASRLRRRDPWSPGCMLAVSWIAVYVGLFSLARTKLPSYVTPCYPGLALLGGMYLDRLLAGESLARRAWQYAAYGVLALVGLAIFIAGAIYVGQVLPGEEWLAAVGLMLAAGGTFGWIAVRRGSESRAVWGFATCAVGFVIWIFGVATDRIAAHQMHPRLWSALQAHSSAPRVASFACLEPSWVFYGGHTIHELSHESVGPTHSQWVEVNGKWERKPRIGVSDFLEQPADSYVLTTSRHVEQVRSLLPADFEVVASVPLFLKEDQLILMGPKPRISRVAEGGSQRR